MSTLLPLAFINNLFEGPDLLVLLGLGILIFGRRLPEVGRNLGQAITGFKKGLKEVDTDVKSGDAESATTTAPRAVPQIQAPRRAATQRALPIHDEP
jgi:sec-independent protein translocase protein TatA